MDEPLLSSEPKWSNKKKCFIGCGVCCGVSVVLVWVLWISLTHGWVTQPAMIDAAVDQVLEKTYRFSDDLSGCNTCPNEDCGNYCASEDGKPLMPVNMTPWLGFMGCKRGFKNDSYLEKCLGSCYSGTNFVDQINKYNSVQPYKLVSFNSRVDPEGNKETISLTAWWLPAENKNAPRIVLQHGNNGNFNEYYIQSAAYLLRSIGFSVIAHNLRDHGTSGKSKHSNFTTWGFDYYLDALGAWDYAVNDPDGFLGGKIDPGKVGMMSFSMGGLVAGAAFGMEAGIPGYWSDSGSCDLGGEMCHQVMTSLSQMEDGLAQGKTVNLTEKLNPGVKTYIEDHAGKSLSNWMRRVANRRAGVDLDDVTPQKTFKLGPDTHRHLAVVSSGLDDFVPPFVALSLDELGQRYPKKYKTTLRWQPNAGCWGAADPYLKRDADYWDSHMAVMPQYPDEYREKLCHFWSGAFKTLVADCKLEALPVINNVTKWKADKQLTDTPSVDPVWSKKCMDT